MFFYLKDPMKQFLFLLLFVLSSVLTFSQNITEIRGTIKDATTGETIIGASVLIAEGKGVTSDIDGNFTLKLDSIGQYTLTISYVGYEVQKIKIKATGKTQILNFSLQTTTLNEVEVVADVAKTRDTPVAFSNISTKQIQEELGTKDLPMVLNSTPGAYATEQGGGSGDARVNIRGFDQRYVAVMVDGVPVNDMENNAVYWSNWDGLGDITSTMQVQRGLGASKLPIPAIGGTINIITKGIDQKMSVNVKQEVNDFGLYRTSFGYNSGQLKGGWGLSIAGSRKWGSEWADGTFTDAWSYFFKVQKRFKKQLISFSVNGSPQKHGMRSTRLPIAIYSKELATDLHIKVDSVYRHTPYTTLTQGERGLKYSPDWGILNGEEFNANGNFYHKPAFNLSDFWSPNDKVTVSTVAYLSLGKGGGTAFKTPAIPRDSTNGTLILQNVYDANINAPPSTYYSSTLHPASNYLRATVNNHLWYGVFSSLNYRVNKNLQMLFGVDARYYKGNHYQTAYDLMGGDYAVDASSDLNQPKPTYIGDPLFQAQMRKEGDKTVFNNDSKVMWGGLFAQAEYKKEKWSTFITGTISEKSYQRIDYYKKKDLVIDGETFAQAVGFGDEFYFNGTDHLTAIYGTSSTNGTSTVATSGDTTFIGTGANRKYILNAKKYTGESSEARYATTKRKWFLGYTVKGGANYNINDHMNAFVNLGYMNMAPLFSSVFDNNNHEYLAIQNQKAFAIEGGYGIKYTKFFVTLNFYYTKWKNKPYTGSKDTPDGVLSYNINGMDAVHKGIEVAVNYKLLKNLDAELLASIADWRTISAEKVYIFDASEKLIDSVDFSAKKIHVGDAAQMQFGASLRYTLIKHLYLKPRFTYFGKHYANFDPTKLIGTNKDRESWKMPNYGLLDIYAGYDYKIWKLKLVFTAGVSNLLNAVYITDGQNGSGFDANTALVYMGMGRRFNAGLKIEF